MNTTTTETASLVSAAMRRAERSKKWTAEKAGIPVSTFLRKVAGHGDFTVGELARIARALDIEPASLLPEEFHVLAAAS